MKKNLLVLLAVLLLALALSSPAAACGGGGGDAWLVFHGDGTAWLIIHGFRLQDDVLMEICAVALNRIPGVTRVLDAMLMDPETGEELDLLPFVPDHDLSKLLAERGPVLGRGIDELPNVRRWSAFSAVPSTDFDEQVVDLAFEVQIDPAYDDQDVAMVYNAVGLYATGGLTADGQPHPDHFEVRRPMEVHTMEE